MAVVDGTDEAERALHPRRLPVTDPLVARWSDGHAGRLVYDESYLDPEAPSPAAAGESTSLRRSDHRRGLVADRGGCRSAPWGRCAHFNGSWPRFIGI
jgi:hypothetical protein